MSIAFPIHFQKHEKDDGSLCVYESGRLVPFDIRRVFTVSAELGAIRGNHAHKKCTQLLICVSGSIRVSVDNGTQSFTYILSDMSEGLLVTPVSWAKQEYLTHAAVLMVLCDRSYEVEDYINTYSEFLIHAKNRTV